MNPIFAIRGLILLVAMLGLAACGVSPEKRLPAAEAEIVELRSMIMGLGAEVDADEADRAARLAFSHTRDLAIQYQIVDPPLIHNTKVNMGLKPRGLCWHWAEDIERRLSAENFETLEMHRAIASPDNPFRIDHSTAIISRRGDSFKNGIVLDPWRLGGVLTFMPTVDDQDYLWEAREEVLMRKRMRSLQKAALLPAN